MKKLKLYERACSSLVLRFSFHQQLLILFIGLFLISNNIVAGANYQDQQEEFTISGKVTASDIGPLPGATVLIVGTQQGTVTDGEGNFQIKVKANDRLLISFVGYASQEVVVSANQTNYSITMAPDLEELSEIVVVGYGTVKKSHLTGAISKVEAEGMEQIAVSRADEALVGKVSGVNI